MNKNTCPTVEQFLRAAESQTGSDDPAIQEHLKTCRACRAIAEAIATPTTAAMEAGADRYATLAAVPQPSRPESGQIWRARQSDGTGRLGILTADATHSRGLPEEVVRFSPLRYRETYMELLVDGEVCLENTDPPLKKWALVEVWNDLPVRRRDLEHCFGQVSPAILNRVRQALLPDRPHQKLPEKVMRFRSRCVREAASLAEPALALIEPASDLVWEIDLEAANEPVSALFAKGPGEDPLVSLKRQFDKLLLKLQDSTFSIIPEREGTSFALTGLEGTALEIRLKNGSSVFFPVVDGRVRFDEIMPSLQNHTITGFRLKK